MSSLPSAVDLSQGRPFEEFYVCNIPDRMDVERWHASPALKDHTIPSSNWCFLACLRMVLLLERKDAPSLDTLFDRAKSSGVYRPKTEAEIESTGPGWRGAILDRIPAFLEEFGLSSIYAREQDTRDVLRAVAQGYYVLPRVGPDIRYPRDTEPLTRTGHFVVLYAYETDRSERVTFRIQNSAGFQSLDSQLGFPVPEARLSQLFSGDAILIRSAVTPT